MSEREREESEPTPQTSAGNAEDDDAPTHEVPPHAPANSPPNAPSPAPLLNYAGTSDDHPVTVARTSELAEAEMMAGDLEAAGIRCTVSNTSAAALGAWGGGARLHVEVPRHDAARAAEVLRLRTLGDDELEPAEDEDDDDGSGEDADDAGAGAPLDEDGRPIPLVVVAAYDRASRMRDAVTTLGAARVPCVVPRIVARGDRPRGVGDRFVVRVRADDLDRARAALADPEDGDGGGRDARDRDEADAEDSVRCPACSSWRVHRLESLWLNLARFFRLAPGSANDDPFQCLACGHKWEPREPRSR